MISSRAAEDEALVVIQKVHRQDLGTSINRRELQHGGL